MAEAERRSDFMTGDGTLSFERDCLRKIAPIKASLRRISRPPSRTLIGVGVENRTADGRRFFRG
jgi:hypothetical protein